LICLKKAECNDTTGAGCVQAAQLWRLNNTIYKDKTMGVLENKENIWNSSLVQIVPKGEDMVRIDVISEEKPDNEINTGEFVKKNNVKRQQEP
jgi:hypothetical protein